MVYHDCLIFEIVNIRLGHTHLDMETFYFILISCFYFILEHEAISFQQTFLKLWIIWDNVSLGIVVGFRLL
jgi:hypothetical protein